MSKDYNITRFYEPHKQHFATALSEIEAGRKQSHWMWYIFPQHNSLGFSYESFYYGIENTEEARLFYNDEYLGGNLRNICRALLESQSDSAFEIFGHPDDIKLRSSMTLFYIATQDELFADVLKKFCDGRQDEITIERLG